MRTHCAAVIRRGKSEGPIETAGAQRRRPRFGGLRPAARGDRTSYKGKPDPRLSTAPQGCAPRREGRDAQCKGKNWPPHGRIAGGHAPCPPVRFHRARPDRRRLRPLPGTHLRRRGHVQRGRTVLPPQFAWDETFALRAERGQRASPPGWTTRASCRSTISARRKDSTINIAVRLVGRTSLKPQRQTEGALGRERVVRLLTWLASALDVAHARGVIHRDLTPAIMFAAGDPSTLVDFGIARAAGGHPGEPSNAR